MALEIAKELEGDRTQNGVVIFSDSQAALKALLRPRMPSGQIYLCGCNNLLQQLGNQGIDVEFRWIPAHEGIAGNERVDGYAKEAAKCETLSPHDRKIRLASAAKRGIRNAAKSAWERAWEKEKSGKATKRLLPVPTKKVLEFWRGQRKASVSIMMQIRLNIIGMNRYLWRINKADSPDCSWIWASRHQNTSCSSVPRSRTSVGSYGTRFPKQACPRHSHSPSSSSRSPPCQRSRPS